MLTLALTILLSQGLDDQRVEVVEKRVTLTTPPADAASLPSVRFESLSRTDQATLATLRERFVKRAQALAFGGFGVPPVHGDSAMSRGVVAVARRVEGETTRWVLTTNALTGAQEGSDCCAPCPCSPNGDCAPCAACLSHDCRFVVSGRQLVVTFEVVGQVLRREEVLLQTVVPPPAPPPRRFTVRAENDEGLLAPMLRSRQAAFAVCGRQGEPRAPFIVDAVLDVTGRLSELSPKGSENPLEACLLRVLRSMVAPRPIEPLKVTLFFEPLPR